MLHLCHYFVAINERVLPAQVRSLESDLCLASLLKLDELNVGSTTKRERLCPSLFEDQHSFWVNFLRESGMLVVVVVLRSSDTVFAFRGLRLFNFYLHLLLFFLIAGVHVLGYENGRL